MPSVEDLSLAGCRLGALPEGLAGWRGLTRLGLGDNSLCALPAWLGGLPALRVMELRNNRLAEVPEQLQELEVGGAVQACSWCPARWASRSDSAALAGPPPLPPYTHTHTPDRLCRRRP
jgi:Leucine-rich repeat (LRR) protein